MNNADNIKILAGRHAERSLFLIVKVLSENLDLSLNGLARCVLFFKFCTCKCSDGTKTLCHVIMKSNITDIPEYKDKLLVKQST